MSGIEAKFTAESILNTCVIIMTEVFEETFAYIGEMCVRRIRERSAMDSWQDHTGNLRSSIGYAVYEYGEKQIQSAFDFGTGGEGKRVGQKYIDELASKYPETFALVVIAGMSYAEYVEAHENKDVLASTELWARSIMDRYMKKAVDKATRKIMRTVLK